MIRSLIQLIRPRVLYLGFAVMLPGNVLAYVQGEAEWGCFILMLLTALSLQVLSNIANDYGDAQRGVDQHREGPPRVCTQGQMTNRSVLSLIMVNIVIALFLGGALLYRSFSQMPDPMVGSLSFLFLGVLAILAALGYTLGRYAYGYYGLGDVAVFLFFGLLAVMGSYYMQTHRIDAHIGWLAVGTGCFSVAVLQINNMRDMNSDFMASKHTLATFLGLAVSRRVYVVITLVGLMSYVIFAFITHFYASLLFLLTAPFWILHWRRLLSAYFSKDIGRELPVVVRWVLMTHILWSLGMVIS